MTDVNTIWSRMLSPLAGAAQNVLEIGSFVGASAARFLTLLPKANITCIDPFTGDEFGGDAYNGDVSTIEARFDAAMKPFGSRVRKLASRSVPALESLIHSKSEFDVIFIDGSHERDDIIVDSILCWRLLKVGGIVIWDDYRGASNWPKAERPMTAIHTFLRLHPNHRIVRIGYQLFVRKTADPGSLAQRVRNLALRKFG